jgi:cytochrome c553
MKNLLISLFVLFASTSVFAGGNIVDGRKKAEQVCQTCHGMDGQGINDTYPKLSGQFADYMVKALEDYKSGDRKNAIMSGFAASLTTQDMENVAAYYSALSDKRLHDLSIK